jgi:diadenylate cyclase
LDILIVGFIIYRLLMLVRGSRGWRILLGLLVFGALLFISDSLGLTTVNWILKQATLLGPVALAILFLPELRQALEGLTKLSWFPESVTEVGHEKNLDRGSVEEIVGAVAEMARDRIGAIIVIETGGHLDEIASNGVMLNAKISTSLLGSIFYGQNPLHDGAVVIRGNNILAAACRLPLSESKIERNLHMRHLVVSEEKGSIRVASSGKLYSIASSVELREFLITNTTQTESETQSPRRAWKKDRKELVNK